MPYAGDRVAVSDPTGEPLAVNANPYRPEIVGAFVASAIVLPLETWRRWGELLSPWALDDFTVLTAAMVVALQLRRRLPAAPARWAFVCGGAWFLMLLSSWGSIYALREADPSGLPVGVVIAAKLGGLFFVSWAALRALDKLGRPDPYASSKASGDEPPPQRERSKA